MTSKYKFITIMEGALGKIIMYKYVYQINLLFL